MSKPAEPKPKYLPFGSDGPPTRSPSAGLSRGSGRRTCTSSTRGATSGCTTSSARTRPRADGVPGYHFAVWAPNADYVRVVGDFNGWDRGRHPLAPGRLVSGVWAGFIPGVEAGHLLQVPHRRAGRVHRREDRPVRVHLRDPAEVRRRDLGPELRVERRRLDGDPQGEERARRADQHLRGPPRLVDARRPTRRTTR